MIRKGERIAEREREREKGERERLGKGSGKGRGRCIRRRIVWGLRRRRLLSPSHPSLWLQRTPQPPPPSCPLSTPPAATSTHHVSHTKKISQRINDTIPVGLFTPFHCLSFHVIISQSFPNLVFDSEMLSVTFFHNQLTCRSERSKSFSPNSTASAEVSWRMSSIPFLSDGKHDVSVADPFSTWPRWRPSALARR